LALIPQPSQTPPVVYLSLCLFLGEETCLYIADCNPTPDGRQYLGRKTVTENGRPCQAWSDQSPHSHDFTTDSMYPDGSRSAASNYCRNPDANWTGLWCYTTDPNVRWESCNVSACGQSLQISSSADYTKFDGDALTRRKPLHIAVDSCINCSF